MKSNFLTNLLIAGTAMLFFTSVKEQKSKNILSKFIKSFPGYEIINCTTINIKDLEKALKFAFDSGINNNSDKMYSILFGNDKCFESLDSDNVNTARFAYNLILYFGAGQVKANEVYQESVGEVLELIRNRAKKSGINTEQWFNENYIPTIIQKYS